MAEEQALSSQLHMAAALGDVAMLGQVVEARTAIMESRDEQGRTALMLAAKAGRMGAVQLLLNRGAAINMRETGTCETALFKAASEGYWRVVDLLLERGADCYLGDMSGVTPLMEGARKGYPLVTRSLLQHQQGTHRGHEAQDVDCNGRTALWWAACWGNPHVLHYLLSHGRGANGDPSRPDCHGITPLLVTQRRPLRKRDQCGVLLKEADRVYQLWKARALCDGEAVLRQVHGPSGAVVCGGPSPAVRFSCDGMGPRQDPQAAAGAQTAAASPSPPLLCSTTLEACVLQVVVEGVNGDVFRELLDLMGRTVALEASHRN